MKAPSSPDLGMIVRWSLTSPLTDSYLAKQMRTTAITIAMMTSTPAPTPIPMTVSGESTFNKKKLSILASHDSATGDRNQHLDWQKFWP